MGNLCSKEKQDETPLLQTTIYCSYCGKTYNFNKYYKHYVECKTNYLNDCNKYGDM